MYECYMFMYEIFFDFFLKGSQVCVVRNMYEFFSMNKMC